MKFYLSKWKIVLALFLSLSALAACGGDGSSGGGNNVPAAYTGVTTQATITADNAQALAAGAWGGGMASFQVGEVVPLAVGDGTSAATFPGVLQMAQLLKAPVVRIDPGAPPAARPSSTDSSTMAGDCGGAASYTLSANDSTGAFVGSITFNGYCSEGTTLSSRMNVSGQFDPNTSDLTQMSLSFPSLTVSDGSKTATMAGSVSFTLAADGNGGTEAMDLVLRDSATQKSFWVHNFQASIASGTDADQVSMSGRFYDPEDGYVALSTLTPLTIPYAADLPTQGTLLFAGKDNTAARLTFNVDGALLLVDADGDGTFEQTINNPL